MQTLRVVLAGLLAAVLSGLALNSAALASDPEYVIEYREAVMEAQGGHLSAASRILRGQVPFQQALEAHAEALKALTEELDYIFPEGSDFGDTEAKLAIWDEPEAFAEAVAEAKQATERFHAAAAGDASTAELMQAFRAVGQSCKGCHDNFRMEK